MTPPFSIFFYSRDFNNPVLSSAHALGYPVVPRAAIAPQALTWTAFGGPDRSTLRVDGSATTLLQLAGLLRCPVRISDQVASPVWWGYVDKITINFFGSLFSISLDQLFNKVKVTYSFISPDNRLADQLETDYAESAASQIEFGIKEIVLHRLNLDEDFAEEFRDTFLELHQWPTSVLSTREKPGDCFAIITCSGWIHTLGWQSYENLDGFYANYGPGPGSFQFGISGYRIPSQKFTPSVSCDLKYVYFLLRKNNSPTNVLTARLYSDSGGSPNAVLASSGTVDGASLPATGYSWIRFDFTPYTLSAVTPYWVGVIAAPHATNNFFIRVDENACYHQANHYAKYYSSGAWYVLPNVTSPTTYPDLHFRVVCVSDTGTHLYDIASAGNQFFKNILTLSTGVDASPFKSGQNTCLQELITLMELGTSNNRLILADVSPDMVLRFYEQPDPTKPSVWLDRYGHFYSQENKLIPSHKPPVGQWAGLLDPGHFTMPFDQARAPGCFVQSAKLDCFTNVIKIN